MSIVLMIGSSELPFPLGTPHLNAPESVYWGELISLCADGSVAARRPDLAGANGESSMKSVFEYLGKSSLFRASANLLTASVIGASGGFLFWIVCTNTYPAEEVGVSFALISTATLVAGYSKMGFDAGLIRFFHTTGYANRLVAISYGVPVACSIAFSLTAAVVLEFVLPFPLGAANLTAFVLVASFLSAASIQYSLALAVPKTSLCVVQSLIFQAARILLVVFLALWVAHGVVFSYGAGTALGVLVVTPLLLRISSARSSRAKEGVPFSVRSIAGYSFGNYIQMSLETTSILILPILVLTHGGREESAYFGVAWLAGNLMMTFPASATFALFSEGVKSEQDLKRLARQSLAVGVAILLPLTCVLWLFGSQILGLFGTEYSSNSLSTLHLFVLGSWIFFVNGVYIIIARIKSWLIRMISVTSAGVIVLIASTFVLVPAYGGQGAALAWVLSQFMVGMMILALERNRLTRVFRFWS